MAQRTKTELLATKMHQLMPHKTVLNRWFVRYNENKRRIVNENEIPTLAEFIQKNSTPLRDSKARFVCLGDDADGFQIQSLAFANLKKFLSDAGFVHDDWCMLLPTARQLKLPMLTVLTSGDIKSKPLLSVADIKSSSETAQLFAKLFNKKLHEVSVADVLCVDMAGIEKVIGVMRAWKIEYADVQTFRVFITKLQARLSQLGIGSNDGPFMGITFKKKKPEEGRAHGEYTRKKGHYSQEAHTRRQAV